MFWPILGEKKMNKILKTFAIRIVSFSSIGRVGIWNILAGVHLIKLNKILGRNLLVELNWFSTLSVYYRRLATFSDQYFEF